MEILPPEEPKSQQTSDGTPPPIINIAAEKKIPLIIYVMYLAGLVLAVTPMVGLVMAYMYRKDAPAWVQTHYRYQIRTFWIGLFYGFLVGVLTFLVIGFWLSPLLLIWFIVRCVKGLMHLDKSEPVPGETSWLF